MGNIPSTLQLDITRKSVFDATKNTREITNLILRYVLSRVDIIDINKMSDKTECSKYVIVLAKFLDKIFTISHIYPDRGSDGAIAFKKIDHLKSTTDRDRTSHQHMCLTLAYFYSRIFQIYGALALTLVDDANVMTNIQFPSYNLSQYREGGEDVYQIVPKNVIGGDRTNPIDLLFSQFYTMETHGTYGKLLKKGHRNYRGFGRIYLLETAFAPTHTFANVSYNHVGKLTITVTVNVDGTIYYPKITFHVRPVVSDPRIDFITAIQLTFEKLVLISGKEVPVSRNYIFYFDTGTGTFVSNGKNSMEIITEMINSLMPTIEKNINEYRKRRGEDEIRKTNSPVGKLPPGFELENTLSALKSLKPIPHCVARAMQLLTVNNNDKFAKSSICVSRFVGPSTDKVNKQYGLPISGREIGTSPGINALSNLFYDVISGTSIEISKNNINLTKYIQFMKDLMKLFGELDTTKEGAIGSGKRSISVISNKRDIDICKSLGIIGNDLILEVTKESMKPVNKTIADLFKLQLEHSAKAGAILTELFVITKVEESLEVKIDIHPNIFNKGITEINRINEKARLLLMDYYTGCEKKYLEGVSGVVAMKKDVTR